VGQELVLSDVERQPCQTFVYPDSLDYNPKKGLVQLKLDFNRCSDSKLDLADRIDLYNREQKQKEEASKEKK
jgi:hypothetical protein